MVFELREGRQVFHGHIPFKKQEAMLTIRRLLQPPRLKHQG